jgi:murein tripeptide amidase MpaA
VYTLALFCVVFAGGALGGAFSPAAAQTGGAREDPTRRRAPTRSAPPRAVPNAWLTPAERAQYRTTPDYAETERYCRRLAAASPWVHVASYGRSSQGRKLPLVILSTRRAFTPERARARGLPIVLVQNGIHSGEIEGKDACLELMRDIAITKSRASLLDHVTLLVLPIFSVDAHERRSRYNRINQNGPEEMGWRSTAIGLNLNRDYLKAETPEMRALISQVFTRWWPHLLVDDHTTDGADYKYDLTYGMNHGAGVPPPVDVWLREAFEGWVVPRVEAMGHLVAPYLTFRSGNDPTSGIDFGNAGPRFSTGYTLLHCRPGILVETHMLKSYETRVRATYDLLVALLEEINAHPTALTRAVAEAEAQVTARGRERDPAKRSVVLSTHTTNASVPFAYKGKVTRYEQSDIAGAPVARYTDAPWDTVIPLYREVEPTVTVQQPAGYLVPQEWTTAREHLQIHRVRFRTVARAWTDTVEVAHIDDWTSRAEPTEGHHPITVKKVRLERRLRTFRPGDLWVPLDQPSALVAVHLFEAQAPDALLYWNAFDTVLEFKEYAEDYVMEPIARRMLHDDPQLAAAFRARVASDTTFAKDPNARLDFFYRRSPWADPEQNILPIARAVRAVPEAYLAPIGGAARDRARVRRGG